MARTLPTAGVSPLDVYLTELRPCGYFEHVVTIATTELHALDVVAVPTCVSGSNYVGGNFQVAPLGTAASWVSGIYAKVTQSSTKSVNGYISAAEFEVVNAADNVSDWFVLVLNASNSGANPGTHASYIALRDYGSTDIQSLLWVSTDHTIGTKSDTALMTSFADGAHISHAIRIIAGATPYWILCSSQAPSGT